MVKNMNFVKYHEYLLQRSSLGFLYRKFYLYPKLNKFLDGLVLDVGCGIGDMLNFRPGTIGADINAINVDFCKKSGLPCFLIERGLLPFLSESFDSVLLDNVIEHIEFPEKLILEVYRVLRPGGVVLLGVPGAKGYQLDSDHKVFYDEDALIGLALKHGFVLKSLFHMPFIKSSWLSNNLKQYCIYAVWVKSK